MQRSALACRQSRHVAFLYDAFEPYKFRDRLAEAMKLPMRVDVAAAFEPALFCVLREGDGRESSSAVEIERSHNALAVICALEASAIGRPPGSGSQILEEPARTGHAFESSATGYDGAWPQPATRFRGLPPDARESCMIGRGGRAACLA